MDKERLQAAVREILLAVGEDPDRPGLVETPRRVADMYASVSWIRTTRGRPSWNRTKYFPSSAWATRRVSR